MVSSGDIIVGDKDGVVVGNVNFFQGRRFGRRNREG